MLPNLPSWDELAQSWSGGASSSFEAYVQHIWRIMSRGTIETVYMVGWASLFAILVGIIFGTILYITKPGGIYSLTVVNPIIGTAINIVHRILGTIINVGRSIPFVVLIMLVFPLSRIIVGSSVGSTAAIVPLTIAAIPFMSRIVESALGELDKGIIEAAIAAGATPLQIIFRVLLPESAPGLVSGFTLLIINLITFSAMAGLVGGGGLGQVAQSYGLFRHRQDIMIYTVIVMVLLVQIIQALGQFISRRLDKR
ncbi:MAG: ABC transporter permease [Defluviitaleaceae bacterium]|nr:ABC transporter permease [Defluviitaleaceae bacterium]